MPRPPGIPKAGPDPEALKSDETQDGPLLFGRYSVESRSVFRVMVGLYMAHFFVFRVADIAYLISCDARFPEGLGHLYPSEHERQQSISYTRQTIFVGMMQKTATFAAVLFLMCTPALAMFDECLRALLSRIRRFGGSGGFFQVVGGCLWGWATWVYEGCLLRCFCGFVPNWGRLFRGAIYLTFFAAFFYVLQAPFKMWMFNINVSFGFVNILTVTPAMYQSSLYRGFWKLLCWSMPQFMLYLGVLQLRFGWLLMWAGLVIMALFAQFHMAALAPTLFDASNTFPNSPFSVGRGFPLVDPGHTYPWVSLNRVYFSKPSQLGHFVTRDKSKGSFELAPEAADAGKLERWAVWGRDAVGARSYAQTSGKVPYKGNDHDLEHLERQPWEIRGVVAPAARVGARNGKHLRDELFGFAKDQGVGVGEVYVIDGSYQDARANAFVAGAGADRVIGLYDTLFLGDAEKQTDDSDETDPPSSSDGGVPVFLLGEKLQEVDHSEEEEQEFWHSTPTQAMSDDEIMAILAHELGHAAMHDVEQNMAVQVVTSFATFATLGWMVQSPVLAVSLGLIAPMGHIAAFVFERVVGPTIDGGIKFMTDGLARRKEYAADAYAAKASEKYATGLQTALAKLVVNSNQDPDEPWFYEVLHADHPTLANRWASISKLTQDLYPGDHSKPKLKQVTEHK